MKTKGKGKAIIGIAMAAIMVASVFAAIMPMGSALTPEQKNKNQGDEGYIDLTALAGESVKVLRGETLNFSITGCTIYGYSEGVHGKTRSTTATDYDTKKFSVSDCEYAWFVDVVAGDGETHESGFNSSIDVILSPDVPTLDIEIQNEDGKSIESTTAGQEIYIAISTNLFDDDKVIIKGKNPKGHQTTLLSATNVSAAKNYKVVTDEWVSGEHVIWVKTADDGDLARGLDISSDEGTITIFKEEITIEAENEEPVVGEAVLITVRAPADTDFGFTTDHAEYVIMTRQENNPLKLDPDEPEALMEDYGGKFDSTTDKDGLCKFIVSFRDDRTYRFEVKYTDDGEGVHEADIELDVEKAAVVFDMPATVMIGEDLTIKGTITEGARVWIYFDETLILKDKRVTDGVFEEDWDTSGKKKGSYRIDVYIDLDKEDITPPDIGADKEKLDDEGIDEAGTTTVRLVEPGLDAEQPRDVIAEEDDYVVEGTATGVSDVDIVIVGPDGFDGTKYTMENGLVFETASVDKDNLFDAEIDTTNADTGRYTVLVLTPGRDGHYGKGYGIPNSEKKYADGDLEKLLTDEFGYDFGGKDKDQIIGLIVDVTTEDTASDDLMDVLTFMIESPYVELDAIEDVGVSEPLIVSGTTNREDETVIMITLTGPVEKSATVDVMDNKFNATIDTTDLTSGIYTVEADDGDNHIDTATVEILEEAAPEPTATPEPTAEPTATAIPTPAATPEPTAEPTAEPTPEPPGFEAVFAIAGLLAIAYLVLRRRK